MSESIEATQTEGEPRPERPEDQPVPSEPTPEEEEHEQEEHEAAQADPEPEEPQARVHSEKDIEKAMDKLDREAKRHRDRISEIMGDDATVLLACPLCDPMIPGFVMPTPAVPERFPAVREFMGESPEPELPADPRAERCSVCDGFGQVATGSRTETHKAMVCEACRGAGAVGPRFEQAAPPAPVLATAGEQNGPTTPNLTPEENAQVENLRRKGVVVIPPAAPAAV